MSLYKLFLLALFVMLFVTPAHAQTFGLDAGQTPVLEFGFGYTYMHSNAPPSGCGCFSLNGGYGSMIVHSVHGIALVADLSSARAGNVNGTTQNITVFDALFGPRYYYHPERHYTPYVQALIGGTEEGSNYLAVQGATSFAASGGGGVNMRLSRYWGWNIGEVDYVYSRLPNAGNDRQSDLRVSTGITFRLGPR
jgi:outer membrane immunogenic protein